MKQIYSLLSKTLLIAATTVALNKANAQSSSTTSPGNCGLVVANFNTTNQNFNSPSVYGGQFDSAFYYNLKRGWWTEGDDGTRSAPGSPRVVSIISPPYVNPSPAGTFDVGFFYIVPNATLDRFMVRIIALKDTIANGMPTTVTNVVATSGIKSFNDPTYGTHSTYIDTASDPVQKALNSGDSGHVCIRINDADITNASNTVYRIEITYVLNAGDGTFSVFDNLRLNPGGSQIPLPVNFMGIVAKRDDNSVTLRWDVGQEINVKEYQVERSINGSSFAMVGV